MTIANRFALRGQAFTAPSTTLNPRGSFVCAPVIDIAGFKKGSNKSRIAQRMRREEFDFISWVPLVPKLSWWTGLHQHLLLSERMAAKFAVFMTICAVLTCEMTF